MKNAQADFKMPFHRLRVWNAAKELIVDIYQATESFPGAERFGLTSQIRRAAVSVAANLAEGSAKRGSAEFRRYLDIALGSLAELAALFEVAESLGMIAEERVSSIQKARNRVGQMVWRLYEVHRAKSLKKR